MGELGKQEARFLTLAKLLSMGILLPIGLRFGQHLEKRLEPRCLKLLDRTHVDLEVRVCATLAIVSDLHV
jgi:hypothetical protein